VSNFTSWRAFARFDESFPMKDAYYTIIRLRALHICMLSSARMLKKIVRSRCLNPCKGQDLSNLSIEL
jgi:hypothetical protein